MEEESWFGKLELTVELTRRCRSERPKDEISKSRHHKRIYSLSWTRAKHASNKLGRQNVYRCVASPFLLAALSQRLPPRSHRAF